MQFIKPDLLPAAPEIALLGFLCLVLIVDLFVPPHRRIVTWWLSIAVLVATLVITVMTAPDSPVLTFSGSYIADPLGEVLKIAAIGTLILVFVYSRDYLVENGLARGEFYLLGLFGLLGIMVMISANNMLVMYLGLELLSLSLYALVAFDRNSSIAPESAMKYFVLGAIASGILLYGISLLYGKTGSIQFDTLAAVIAAGSTQDVGLWFGLAFVIVGIAFKFGAVPFHMWLPDVYHGARAPVTLYVGTIPKVAAFALAFRVLAEALPDLHSAWQGMIMILAVLSLVVGNVVAIAQTNFKRLLAYSTISHVGFILLGIFAGTEAGYEAALFYTLTYVLMAAAAFGMINLLSWQGYEADELDDLRGLNARSPWFAAMLACVMFGMAGIPPWVGFWGKLNVINAVLAAGDGPLYPALALIMVVMSVVGAYYYLRVLKLAYFDEPEYTAPIDAAGDVRFVLSANALAILAIGIVPGTLLALCARVLF